MLIVCFPQLFPNQYSNNICQTVQEKGLILKQQKNNDVTTWDTLNTVSLTRCHSDKGTQDGSEGTSRKKKRTN